LYRKAEEAEAEAVEIIERYIRKREAGIRGNRLVPAYKCLLCELDEIPYKLFDRMTEELERDICELMEEWDREDFDSDGGKYDETGHL
jgi:oligoribonuclease (3'-5' exoribonuclease)